MYSRCFYEANSNQMKSFIEPSDLDFKDQFDLAQHIYEAKALAQHAKALRLNKDQSTLVNTGVKWIKVNSATKPAPQGVKLQLINRADGNACYGVYTSGDNRWTHYQGVPTFDENEE